ncbi:hypothetical protein CIRG_08923 [Coccidioides immitis RMSCC 2394]|uniref:Uncharacterized protein n=1 Tax=Coccidioides immitis RMSCC 2394 TaxID=404692 RepID=A0A0J7BG78_COCIT|nr:hypothetical protein CIRG_08923 [Coccidioides immitis RMSCC 2394]
MDHAEASIGSLTILISFPPWQAQSDAAMQPYCQGLRFLQAATINLPGMKWMSPARFRGGPPLCGMVLVSDGI